MAKKKSKSRVSKRALIPLDMKGIEQGAPTSVSAQAMPISYSKKEEPKKESYFKTWSLSSLWLVLYSLTILFILAVFMVLLFYIPSKRTYVNLAIESNKPQLLDSRIEEGIFSANKAVFTDFDKLDISYFTTHYSQSKTVLSGDNISDESVTLLSNPTVINEEEFKDPDSYMIAIQSHSENVQAQPPTITIETDLATQSFDCSITTAKNGTITEPSCDSLIFDKSGFIMNGATQGLSISGYDRNYARTTGIIKGIEVKVTINNCDVQLYRRKELIRQYSMIEPLVINLPYLRDISLAINGANCSFSGVNNLQCTVSKIHSFDLFGDGKVTVTYIPDSKDYTFLKQPVYIHSQDGSFLSAKITQAKEEFDLAKLIEGSEKTADQEEEHFSYSLSAYGFADDIRLANISLLPDIFTWLRENIYLLPASIITIILGAIQLIKLKKKDNIQ